MRDLLYPRKYGDVPQKIRVRRLFFKIVSSHKIINFTATSFQQICNLCLSNDEIKSKEQIQKSKNTNHLVTSLQCKLWIKYFFMINFKRLQKVTKAAKRL